MRVQVVWKRSLLAALCGVLGLTVLLLLPGGSFEPLAATDAAAGAVTDAASKPAFPVKTGEGEKGAYARYLREHADGRIPSAEIRIDAERQPIAGSGVVAAMEREGAEGSAVLSGESGEISWDVDVQEEGLYQLFVRYYSLEGRSEAIERALLIDGRLPFNEAERLVFPRAWGNKEERIRQDANGNDLRPSQVEIPAWEELALSDADGYYEEPYRFYFTKGKHRITLRSVREPMLIDYLALRPARDTPAYEDLRADYERLGYGSPAGVMITVQGEDAAFKSSPTLYPLADRSSPATEPFHPTKIRLNTIGGNNWRIPGQSITWTFDAPQDGLYKIAVKYRQHFVQSLEVPRRLRIDGQVPFAEANRIGFKPGGGWQMMELGNERGENGEPYLFYLTKGKHRLSLEVTLGEMAPHLHSVEQAVLELNRLYRKIIMITGASPDPFRDYELQKRIPELRETFEEQGRVLRGVIGSMEQMYGGKGERMAVLNTVAFQLQDLAEDPESIAKRLDAFKSNIVALGTWMLTAKELPLEIDYLIIASGEARLPQADASWLAHAEHGVRQFLLSFFTDYDAVGVTGEETEAVDVWITGGRDQAQLIKSMIDTSFTPWTGIPVNLRLVDPSVLLPATLAGSGPDVALASNNVINFALRGALQDLSVFDSFQDVKARFAASAFVPFEYEGGVYAIPEQQTFPMLFYRKDVLDEIGAKVPQTWEELYALIPVLNKRQLSVGLTPELTMDILLYQSGGAYYKDGGKASGLDSEEALSAFKRWTDLYVNYKAPQQFDFINRFRIGEMPVGIADYTTYNSLVVFAPEIRGLWAFAPVPGTAGSGGAVHRETASVTLGSVMFKRAGNKDNAWTFIDWWTGKEAQLAYGRELEALMGAAARYPTANLEALRELPWPAEDFERLKEQLEWVRGVPDVPGGYFTQRHLNNAFFEVLNKGANPRETLKDYVRTINQEITVKRREFHLPTVREEDAP